VNSVAFCFNPFDRCFFAHAVFRCVLPNILCDAHGTEVRTTHATEVRGLGAFRGKSFVVEFARGFGIE